MNEYVIVEQSMPLHGTVVLNGAKNAVLVIMASTILAGGKTRLENVPFSDDVRNMMQLLTMLGATVSAFEESGCLEIDASSINNPVVSPEIMKKMRASILVMGPLLARFGRADVAVPGGCLIGLRPIDYHLKAFKKMGVQIEQSGDFVKASCAKLQNNRFVLEYPSVGATENIMMACVLTPGISQIVNAAIEPEVLDLIDVLQKMGARILLQAPATIVIEGVTDLKPINHAIMPDRLEAGAFLLAAAITKGSVHLPQARAESMEVFLEKLSEMGHVVEIGADGKGISLRATEYPQAVSFKTMPFPGFPTDLQAPMTAALCLASGTSVIEETVFENRLLHAPELQKMGAQIRVDGNKAIIKGVDQLYGAHVIATDIRASCGLVLAGLAAQGKTVMTGVHHLRRGYQGFDLKLAQLGGRIMISDQ